MKFGKSLRYEISATVPQWGDEFISYKELKKQLNLIALESDRCRKGPGLDSGERDELGFTRLLESDLDKMNAFFVRKEEEYWIRLKVLQDEVTDLDYTEEDATQVIRELLDFHGEMVLLLHYNVLNFEGLIKIIKKHFKKTGTSLHSPILQSFQQNPFFTTNSLYKLLKECEAMVSQLLPSSADSP